MDDNIKKLTERDIARGLAKMEKWEGEVSDHIKATYKRSMRFLAQDIVDEMAGQRQPDDVNYEKYETSLWDASPRRLPSESGR